MPLGLRLYTHYDICLDTQSAIDSRVDVNGQLNIREAQTREESRSIDGVIHRASHIAVEVSANLAVEGWNCSGLWARDGIIEEVHPERIIRKGRRS